MSAKAKLSNVHRRLAVCLMICAILVVKAIAWRSWVVFVILLIPTFVIGDWISEKAFGPQGVFRDMSTSVVGFSLWRILLGVAITLALFLLVMTIILGMEFPRALIGR